MRCVPKTKTKMEWEPRCIAFHEARRPVRTASASQVRRPIYREGVDHWRHYASWLEPLEQALGPVLGCYPEPPAWGVL